MVISWRSSLLVCTLLALLVHGLVLYGVRSEMAALSSPLHAVAEPMFTRQITRPTNAPEPPVATVHTAKTAAQARGRVVMESRKKSIKTPKAVDGIAKEAPEIIANTSPEATVSQASDTAQDSTVAQTMPTPTNSTATNGTESLAALDSWPGDTRLSYRLGGYFRGDLHGSAQVQWTRQAAADAEQRYQTRVSINLGLTSVQLTSQGVVSATGLQPLAYEEVLPGGRRRSMQVEGGFLVLQDGKRLERPAAALADMQDSASQFVSLGHRFSTGRARLAEGEVVRVWLARPGGLDEWVYDVGAPEMLQLPVLGAVQAFRLAPRPLANPRGNITAQMWIAPSLQYLPVRIRIDVGTDTYVDLTVEKVEQR